MANQVFAPGWGLKMGISHLGYGQLPSGRPGTGATGGLWWLGVGVPEAPVGLVKASVGLGEDAQSIWPPYVGPPSAGPRATVVIVCWATVGGAEAAMAAATQHARQELSTDAGLAGVLAVEMPGKRQPREARRRLAHVQSLVPRVWTLPWEPAWSTRTFDGEWAPSAIAAEIRTDLELLPMASTTTAAPGPQLPPPAPPAARLEVGARAGVQPGVQVVQIDQQ